jgi:C1A family cysteine protease
MTPIVDLRAKLLPARQQGRRHSCLAFAGSAVHEYRLSIQEHLCVEYLYYFAIMHTPGHNPNLGATMAAISSALVTQGQPVETAWPYSAKQPEPWTPPPITSTVYKANVVTAPADFDHVVAMLNDCRPQILGLVITDSFFAPDALGMVLDRTPDIERGCHAVVAVGHGQSATGMPAILIRNSWGTDWGLQGHAWLSRHYVERHLHEVALLQ